MWRDGRYNPQAFTYPHRGYLRYGIANHTGRLPRGGTFTTGSMILRHLWGIVLRLKNGIQMTLGLDSAQRDWRKELPAMSRKLN